MPPVLNKMETGLVKDAIGHVRLGLFTVYNLASKNGVVNLDVKVTPIDTIGEDYHELVVILTDPEKAKNRREYPLLNIERPFDSASRIAVRLCKTPRFQPLRKSLITHIGYRAVIGAAEDLGLYETGLE